MDAGFGIFAVAWEAWLMKRDFVFRMTDSRFQALFLVTSLPHSADALSDLYLKRGDIEIDISNLKVVLNTERQTARSVEMFPKELLTSLVAYNLVTQFRRQAAPTAPLNAKPIPDDQSPTNSKNVNPNSPLINQIPKVSAIAR